MAENISYEYLFDLLRREKTREDLQSIDKDFYKNIFSNLLKREKNIQKKQSQKSLVTNTDFEKEKIEVKNIRKVVHKIMNLRQKKIILLALSRARIPSTIINDELFTKKEYSFFNDCVKLFRNFRPSIEKNAPKQEASDKETKKEEKEPPKKEKPSKKEPEKEEKKEEPSEKKEKVKFLSDMSKFYGPHKELLGPFEKGQVAEVPPVIAKILVKKGRAKIVENA